MTYCVTDYSLVKSRAAWLVTSNFEECDFWCAAVVPPFSVQSEYVVRCASAQISRIGAPVARLLLLLLTMGRPFGEVDVSVLDHHSMVDVALT